MSATTEIRMINLQVMAEDAIQADKAAGTYASNFASDAKYYLWQSGFQTIPTGMEGQPEAYAQLLRSSLPDINTIRLGFNNWSFNEDGTLDPMFERFLTEATRQGFEFVFVYADGEAQRLGQDGTLDLAAMRDGLTGSVHDRMVSSWDKMLDWLDAHPEVAAAVYALEAVNEPASYSRAETLGGGTGEFVRLYGDHMAEIAHLIEARSDARIMVGGWAYSSLFDILAETAASSGEGSVLDQIRTAAGADLVWSAHLYPDWAAGAGQDFQGMAEFVSQRYDALGDDDLIITETNLEGHTAGMAFWMARAYEVFSEAGIGLGWFPGAETGASSFVMINNGKVVNFLHPDIYAQGMNAFLLGESDPDHASAENLVARLLRGNVHDESGARLATVDGLGYAAGHAGNDMLVGIERAINMLYGGTGYDSLSGTGGRDHLFGQGDGDTLFGFAGDDILMGGDGDDLLNGGAGNDILTGGRGGDRFVLDDGGEDVLTDFRGDLGDQIVLGGRVWTEPELSASGSLVDHDGDGIADDLVMAWAGGKVVLLNHRRPDGIVQATEGDDNVAVGYVDVEGDKFTWEGAKIQGLGGNDTINGSMLDDTLEGGNGDDVLTGRTGNDLLSGGEGMDNIVGHDGADTLDGGSGNDLLYGESGNDLIGAGIGNDRVTGGSGRDTLNGHEGDDTIDGGGYDDLVNGGADNDNLAGAAGNDTMNGDAGSDVLSGGYGHDRLVGGDGNDSIDGNGDNDLIDGGIGDDTLVGSSGNDTLVGSTGIDVLSGGSGNDTYVVDSLDDRASESWDAGLDEVQSWVSWTLGANFENLLLTSGHIDGTGNTLANFMLGNAGRNMLEGAAGNDTLDGASGNDIVSGGAGNDVLIAGAGSDRVIGGQGTDLLTGSQGADLFVFQAAAESAPGGRDTITDFSVAGGDRIDLLTIDAQVGRAGDQAFSFIGAKAFTGTAGELSAYGAAGRTVIAADINGDRVSDFEILLEGSIALSADSFLL
ncbi:calcium-binding protein [Paracoccus benzoatiresistens]|uniref:Calcium-binding protein n=1 Tax=Paracoccus benzoatiresistens TaxID=2997341 RepID=A0ABT4J342_9RHOB|nr:calcium-binding protein [Paracoccus sp. EF6]MCZ0961032.1 calcium-binding protein [Paracoccus sp. EF6]